MIAKLIPLNKSKYHHSFRPAYRPTHFPPVHTISMLTTRQLVEPVLSAESHCRSIRTRLELNQQTRTGAGYLLRWRPRMAQHIDDGGFVRLPRIVDGQPVSKWCTEAAGGGGAAAWLAWRGGWMMREVSFAIEHIHVYL